MASGGIQRIGNQLVVLGATTFMQKMNRATRSVDDFSKSVSKASKTGKGGVLPKSVASGVKQFDSATVASAASLTKWATVAATATAAAFVLAKAVGVVRRVMLDLSQRGSALLGVVEAFDRLTAAVGLASDSLLSDMRRAVRGTVTDLELMRKANLALAGSSDEFGQMFGKALPRLLEIARAQARATGLSVDYMFNSIVSGIKRSSPLIIDNLGIVIDMKGTYDNFAASIGKTGKELTKAEKQMAVLNATLASGEKILSAYGEQTLTSAEIFRGITVTLENLKNEIGLVLEPVTQLIGDVAATILDFFVKPLRRVVLPIIHELVSTFVGPLLSSWRAFKQEVASAFAPLANFVKRALIPTIATIRLLGEAFKAVVAPIAVSVRVILRILGVLNKKIFDGLDPQKFFEGGARMIGALAAGMLAAANRFVFPVVNLIAQTIADFLVGLSPPPKGPLHFIETGGANVMLAWLEGFTGVSLEPVRKVAQAVDEQMGKIANMSIAAVEARLAALDEAIRPFQERLKIVEDRMKAILDPLTEIDKVLSRRLSSALSDFFAGKGSAEAVRALDAQREELARQKSVMEQISDEAKFQLSLKQLQQINERSLLEIQLARLRAQEKVDKKTKDKAKKEKKAGGSGKSDATSLGTGGISPLLPSEDAVMSFLGIDETAVRKSMARIAGAVDEGFRAAGGPRELAKARANMGKLSESIRRIGDSRAFSTVKKVFDGIFGVGEGTLVHTLVTFASRTKQILAGVVGVFEVSFRSIGLIVRDLDLSGLEGISSSLSEIADPEFTSRMLSVSTTVGLLSMALGFVKLKMEGVRDSIAEFLEDLRLFPINVATELSDLAVSLHDSLYVPIRESVFSVWEIIHGAGITARTAFSGIVTAMETWLKGLVTALEDSLVTPMSDAISRVIDAIIGDGPNSLKTKISEFPNRLVEWLSDLPQKIRQAFTEPFTSAINTVTSKLSGIGEQIEDLLGIGSPGGSGGGSGGGGGGGIGFGASGGRPRPGELWVVGENGWEFFRPDVPGTIIPHEKSVRMAREMMSPRAAGVGRLRGGFTPSSFAGGPITVDYSRASTSSVTNITQNNKFYSEQALRLMIRQAGAF